MRPEDIERMTVWQYVTYVEALSDLLGKEAGPTE
jgi:hypothetical protein